MNPLSFFLLVSVIKVVRSIWKGIMPPMWPMKIFNFEHPSKQELANRRKICKPVSECHPQANVATVIATEPSKSPL